MVFRKVKFICGLGSTPLYYCKKCGTPHLNEKDARKCEMNHLDGSLKPIQRSIQEG